MNNNKFIVFMDLEADSIKWKQRSKAELLQLSGVKTLNGEIVGEFNEYCFNKKISKKISNLLRKEREWFNNKKFKSTKEVYKLFYEFSKGCQIYNFGNFDHEILRVIYRKYFKNNVIIKLIKLEDFQIILKEKMKIPNYSLIKIAKILNIKAKESHDALLDSKLLFRIFQKIHNSNFNLNNYENKKQLIDFCPNLTNHEFVNFKLNDKKYILKEKYNLVYINLNWINKFWINHVKFNDIFISDKLKNEIFKEEYSNLEIEIKVIDSNSNLIENIKFNKIFHKNKKKNYSKIENLQNFVKKYENDIFLCSKKILIDFSKLWNRQFYYVTNKSKYSNVKDLKNIRINIDFAIKEFSND